MRSGTHNGSGPDSEPTKGLNTTITMLENMIETLHHSVQIIKKQTQDVPELARVLQTKALFDVLPERLMVKPILEKDNKTLDAFISKYKVKKQILQQQSRISKLKLDSLAKQSGMYLNKKTMINSKEE
ncbi:hypothetical protein CAS74_003427 [Pichia kudriavzevii]|uniref:Uncharacterized protein n=1 Tax=Pichia kudriavzevii TaxID=4909 RepID=A0A1Z8JL53_PICKU|nr:hypothetical protein CAS74_003427 [Pichia kudriavzevii]